MFNKRNHSLIDRGSLKKQHFMKKAKNLQVSTVNKLKDSSQGIFIYVDLWRYFTKNLTRSSIILYNQQSNFYFLIKIHTADSMASIGVVNCSLSVESNDLKTISRVVTVYFRLKGLK